MEKKIPYPYRVNVCVSKEQREKLTTLLRWGVRQRVMEKVVEMLTDFLEKSDNPDVMAAYILDDQLIFSLREEGQSGNPTKPQKKSP